MADDKATKEPEYVLTLQKSAVARIIDTLAVHPYNQVAVIINEIITQVNAQPDGAPGTLPPAGRK